MADTPGSNDVKIGGAYVELGLAGLDKVDAGLGKSKTSLDLVGRGEAGVLRALGQHVRLSRELLSVEERRARVRPVAQGFAQMGAVTRQLQSQLQVQTQGALGRGVAPAVVAAFAAGQAASLQGHLHGLAAQALGRVNAPGPSPARMAAQRPSDTPLTDAFDPRKYGAGVSRGLRERRDKDRLARAAGAVDANLVHKATMELMGVHVGQGTPGDKDVLLGATRDRLKTQSDAAAALHGQGALENLVALRELGGLKGRSDFLRRRHGELFHEQTGGLLAVQQMRHLRMALTSPDKTGYAAGLRDQFGKTARTRAMLDLEGGATEALQNRIAAGHRTAMYGTKQGRGLIRSKVGDDLGTETEALHQQVTVARERQRYLASPAGRTALREQVRLVGEQTKLERELRKQQLIAEHGQVGGRLKLWGENLDKWRAKLREFGAEARAVFTGLAAGVLSSVSAASPTHFATLTGSFRLLGATIGSAFLPMIDEASLALQRAARWVSGLSEETKASMAAWVKWGLLLSGGAYLAAKAFGLLAGVAKIAIGAVGLVVAHPVVAGVVALTAAVGGLAIAFGKLPNEAAAARSELERLRGLELRSKLGQNERKDWEAILPGSMHTSYRAALGKPEEMTKVMEELKRFAQHSLAGGLEGQVARRVEEIDKEIARVREKPARSYGEMSTRLGEIDRLQKQQATFEAMVARPKAQLAFAEAGLRAGGHQTNEELLRAFRGPAAPGFSSFAEFSDKLQVAALRADDLETKISQEQLKALQKDGILLERIAVDIGALRAAFPSLFRGQ